MQQMQTFQSNTLPIQNDQPRQIEFNKIPIQNHQSRKIEYNRLPTYKTLAVSVQRPNQSIGYTQN